MKCAVKKPVQLRLCRQTKCPTHLRLRAYLIKCLETTRRPWIRINFHRIAETFGVCDRTLRRAKKRLEQDNDLKFRTLSKSSGSGWVVIVALEANLLWDKEPLFYKKQQEQFRSRNVKDRHCGDLIEERMARCRDRGVPVYTYETIPQKRWPSLQHVPVQGTRGISSKNKGISQCTTYWLTANRFTIGQGSSAKGLKGRCFSRGIPVGNGENVAESSAFVDSLRKCNERTEDYESSYLIQGWHRYAWSTLLTRGTPPASHQSTPDPRLTDGGGTQSQAQCGDLLHRRPSPDPRLTEETDSKSASSSPNAQTTSLTRSPAPVVAGKHHDQRVRVPQVINDSNHQQPESQSGGSPFAGRNRTGDKSLTDTHLYRERVPSGRTAVKTRSQRSRRWILAASGAELRRLATRKQIRLAYFHARSGCTWYFWDNIKIKEQPEVAKSLWLAGFLAGFDAKTIDKAFDDALHESHGMATDVGLNEGNPRLKFEMSHTVSLAKEILIRKLDKPENSKN